MRALVTGAAGFIGSHLCETLLAEGDEVVGVDSFTPYYPRPLKERNLLDLIDRHGFHFLERDVVDLREVLDEIDVVYHLAAQPGVRASWGPDFEDYVRQNVVSTRRLLEDCAGRPLKKFVFASSSSVYGDAETYPTPETALPRPVSPYGVTKLAAEHLCEAYRKAFSIPTASLRLFTVYGPRQRPDMAFARLVEAASRSDVFEVYGEGDQTRDFTFVADVVRAFRACALSEWFGIANIGGGSRSSLNDAIRIIQEIAGPVTVRHKGVERGDVRHTGADITRAREAFGWSPQVPLPDGLRAMVGEA